MFEDDAHAKIFVEKLSLYLIDVSCFRDGCEVKVFDGSNRGLREEIYRLAKSSSALHAVKI